MRICSHRGRVASLFAAVVAVLTIVCASSAAAHVKWFAPFHVAASPRPLASVLSPTFAWLFLVSLAALWTGTVLERTSFGHSLRETLDRLTGGFEARTDSFLRACGGAFFVALWVLGDVILTPELKTHSPVIPWLQAGIAIGLLWRPTMVLSGIGIVALYAVGVANYGPFHLMDYPIFLGLAGYFILSGLDRTVFGLRPVDVARWGAGITLMWASVEKWAYPNWTYPLLVQHPQLTLGWDPGLYMTAAGMVEFVLAFALILTPLVRRMSALMLLIMFISAVFEFGKIDAIGHLMIIAILVAVLADGAKTPTWPPLPVPVLHVLALAATLSAYYGLHVVVFGAA
jgi:hypothetical protein